ncbi:hypothetical protein HMPREF1868_01923 [Olsenella sp. DNF00959]|nr:hypothetical protein HMPREF1868_01923 [Olsenella sp. DNF00959]
MLPPPPSVFGPVYGPASPPGRQAAQTETLWYIRSKSRLRSRSRPSPSPSSPTPHVVEEVP